MFTHRSLTTPDAGGAGHAGHEGAAIRAAGTALAGGLGPHRPLLSPARPDARSLLRRRAGGALLRQRRSTLDRSRGLLPPAPRHVLGGYPLRAAAHTRLGRSPRGPVVRRVRPRLGVA